MVRVAQDRKKKLELISELISVKSRNVNHLLRIEADSSGIYDSTYQATINATVNTLFEDIIGMLRWTANSEGFTVPAAKSDAEIDAINIDIRTKEA